MITKFKVPNKISVKLKKRKLIYKNLRIDFLARNPYCAWGLKQNPPRRIPATQTHHKFGRIGRLLNYVPAFIAVSAEGHDFINNNPDKAREFGLLCQRGQYNSYNAAVKYYEG